VWGTFHIRIFFVVGFGQTVVFSLDSLTIIPICLAVLPREQIYRAKWQKMREVHTHPWARVTMWDRKLG
jgi:hypothetical protein